MLHLRQEVILKAMDVIIKVVHILLRSNSPNLLQYLLYLVHREIL